MEIALNRTALDRNLEEALPEGFSFYDLGEVKLLDSAPELFSNLEKTDHRQSAYRYFFNGDVQGALILFFDEALDPSPFAEMGNIIAGRCAGHLEKHHEFEVMISPPELMTSAQIRQIGIRKPQGLFRTYRYLNVDREIRVHVLILPMRLQEAGHA